jgi:hypothetical protein
MTGKGKQTAGKWFDTWTKRLIALSLSASVLSGVSYQGYAHFAKAWEVAEIQIKLDKRDLLEVRKQIAQLEAEANRRALTGPEQEWLRQLRQIEAEIVSQIKQRGG